MADTETGMTVRHSSPQRQAGGAAGYASPQAQYAQSSSDALAVLQGPSSPGENEPRPILRPTSHVRISSPLRKQVGFEDQPRWRPALRSSHSASGSIGDQLEVPTGRVRRGRSGRNAAWAQTIHSPASAQDLEQMSGGSVPPMNRPVYYSQLSGEHVHEDRGILRPARSLNANKSSRPASTISGVSGTSRTSRVSRMSRISGWSGLTGTTGTSSSGTSSGSSGSSGSTGSGLWHDVPVPSAPHPSTAMPGFPVKEFADHRPPKFSRDSLRRGGVIMPKAARPATVMMDTPPPQFYTQPPPAEQQPQAQSNRRSVTGFLSRKLSRRSPSNSATVSRRPVTPEPNGICGPLMVSPEQMTQQGYFVQQGYVVAPPGYMAVPIGQMPPQGYWAVPAHVPVQMVPQWPQQSMHGSVRSSALPPGAEYMLSPGGAYLRNHQAEDYFDGMHSAPQHEVSRHTKLRHHRSVPGLSRSSPLDPLPEDAPSQAPSQWVERVPPPHLSPQFEPQQTDEVNPAHHIDFSAPTPRIDIASPSPTFDYSGGVDFSANGNDELLPPPEIKVRAPHLSIDFGEGDIWGDLERSFGNLALPDLPRPSSRDSDESEHTHTAHTTFVTSSAENGAESETPRSPSTSPSRRDMRNARKPHRAASEGGHLPLMRPPSHLLSASAPPTPLLAATAFGVQSTLERYPSNEHQENLVGASESEHDHHWKVPARRESHGSATSRPVHGPASRNDTPPRGHHTTGSTSTSRSPSSMSLRSSMSMSSEASTISSLPSTVASMTSASSAASVDMPEIVEDADNEANALALDVYDIVPPKTPAQDTPRPTRAPSSRRKPVPKFNAGETSTDGEVSVAQRAERVKPSVAAIRSKA